jgi:hypothetical protein
MVTRRAVLKGTAAASIGAIAAAHGAAPAEAASLDVGYGQLTGGAVGAFQKFRDAFQIAVKFNKIAADIFIKEDELSGGVAVFSKFFDKEWIEVESVQLGSAFSKDLKTSELYFSKIGVDKADFFLKDRVNQTLVAGTVELNKDGLFYKIAPTDYSEEPTCNPDGEIG